MSEFDDYMRGKAEAKAMAQRKQETASFESSYVSSVKERLAKQAVLDAMKLEEEIVQWIEAQSREDLEQLLRQGNAAWYVGPGKSNKDIATHISEYLEFLDRCDAETKEQENQRQANPTWGIFG